MTFDKWDIILVPFPFTDLSSTKKRPALIISDINYNEHGDTIIVFITSQISPNKKPGDYLIGNWKNSGLPKPSLIRMKFATIDNTIILKKLGTLSESDRKNFAKVFKEFFSL